MNVQDLLSYGKARLLEAGIENGANEAEYFLCHLLQVNRTWIFLHSDAAVSAENESQYRMWISKRCTHYPMQYILGEQPFMEFCFYVNEHVLIPRQDTEILVEQAMKRLKPHMHILDLCCGSGCIGLSLAKLSGACVTLADISEKAIEVAGKNAERLGLTVEDGENEKNSVRFVVSDIFERIEGQYDMIVSNPPYIRSDVIPTLMEEVRDFEPALALDGGGDGLDFYRRIVKEAGSYLNEDGYICFEIGYDQGNDLRQILVAARYGDIEIVKDLAGLDRVVLARKLP
ncbi:MAG: peptide chain release factor N(5)-glutamine methyltransferase [Lachnospiraceae bacterium]|nr:peptide chain release factor N(5)-glutamine methyltransferase [Lachnospiraceae bacterium]